MKIKILTFIIIMSLVGSFIYFGLPFLKSFKSQPEIDQEKTLVEGTGSVTGKRTVTVDLSVESICKNMITNEMFSKCSNSTSCDITCENEGCKYFGLYYEDSDFSTGKCICRCLEENKIKKALSGSEP